MKAHGLEPVEVVKINHGGPGVSVPGHRLSLLEVGPMFLEAHALGHLVNGYVFEPVFSVHYQSRATRYKFYQTIVKVFLTLFDILKYEYHIPQ